LSLVSSSPARSASSWPQRFIGLAFTTLAALILELALTRVFSVVFYYHFAFLAISVAMFGLGAGGVFSYVIAERPGSLYGRLGTIALANSFCVIAALAYLLAQSDEPSGWAIVPVYLASALPFFLAGAVVSLVISDSMERIEQAYFYDLLGAAGGSLLLIPFLNLLGGPNTVLAAGAFFATSAAIWFNLAGSVRRRAVAVAVALLIVGGAVINAKAGFLDVRYAKGQRLKDEIFVRWNSFSRVAVAPEGDRRLHIVIDADAATGIAPFDWDRLTPEDRRQLLSQGPGLVYRLKPGAKTLVLGAGGGWDVGRALASGSRDITAVEINPIIANTVMRDRFAGESHGLYRRPEVRVVVEDGRSFVRGTPEQYQVIQATLVDTWASTAAGAFALSENNLYTTEAFQDYLSRLTEDGVLVFTRWGFDPPRESLRLLSLGITALERSGRTEPARHFVVVRENTSLLQGWGAQDTVLMSREPFSPEMLARLRSELTPGLEIVYAPDAPGNTPFAGLLLAHDRQAFERDYAYDISPVSDNRPFFFYSVQPRDFWQFLTSGNRGSADFKINRAVPLLFGLLGISALATLLTLVLPPLLLKTRLPAEPGVRWFLLYFVCLGAGYVLVQVAFIQKFVLLLGHPTYALAVIVFTMLASSGLGSFYSRRFVHRQELALRKVLAAVALALLLTIAAGTWISAHGGAWPLPVKMFAVAALIAPSAFLMGMPFPAGLAILEAWHPPSVRWAWSLNAAASVFGSAAAIFFAIYVGLAGTLGIGALMYTAALLALAATQGARRPAELARV
jgi:predicted membrane-bound spermidine synthase